MKYIFSFFLLVPFSFLYSQSNLIKNPSLEEWKERMPVGWRIVTNSPDVYKSDLRLIPGGIYPNDFKFRSKHPDVGHDGIAYLGLVFTTVHTEIIEATLTSKLIKGKEYRISCWVYALPFKTKETLKEFTVSFSSDKMKSATPATTINKYISLFQPNREFVKDTLWHFISSTFIANGNENFMQVSYFDKKLSNAKVYYYLFDDFSLSEVNKSVINKSVNFENNESKVKITNKNELSSLLSSMIKIDSIHITGFANELGNEDKNLELSKKRCAEINGLIQKIRPSTKVKIDSKGEYESKGKNLQEFRKVDLKIFYSGMIPLHENVIQLDPKLIIILKNLEQSDQNLRAKYDSLFRCCSLIQSDKLNEIAKQIAISDSFNLIKIKDIFLIYDYPGLSKVGPDYMNNIALMLLHSDVKTMEEYVDYIKFEVEKGEVSPWCYAMMVDKIKISKNEEQIYGSQVIYNEKNKMFEPFPIKDKANVDKRRLEFGFRTNLNQYLENFNGKSNKPKVNILNSKK